MVNIGFTTLLTMAVHSCDLNLPLAPVSQNTCTVLPEPQVYMLYIYILHNGLYTCNYIDISIHVCVYIDIYIYNQYMQSYVYIYMCNVAISCVYLILYIYILYILYH